MRNLTTVQKRETRAIAAKKDEDIDFSDGPPVHECSRTEIGRFTGPKKKHVPICLDSDFIAWLKSDGRFYQTRANLRYVMLHFTRDKNLSSDQSLQWRGNARPQKREA
jgi:uncharacterized protein (DUF4415 family)